MSAQHTPGPWAIRDDYGLLKAEIGPADRAIATVWTKQQPRGNEQKDPVAWAEGEANARLIAAAPELLASLQEVTQLLDAVLGVSGGYPPGADGPAVKAKAAIARATGEQQ